MLQPDGYMPQPLNRLERMVLECGYDPLMGFETACENVRTWLRAEIDRRLREAAKKERVETVCRNCGEVTDVSRSHAEKLVNGRVALPLCLDCRSSARTAQVDTDVVAFIEQLGDRVPEFSDALAALR